MAANSYPRTLPQLETGVTHTKQNRSYLEHLEHSGGPKKKKKRKKKSPRRAKDPSIDPEEPSSPRGTSEERPKRVDFVLVYVEEDTSDADSSEEREEISARRRLRERFHQNLVNVEGISLQEMTVGGKVYVKLHCPFPRLCQQAEEVKLEMPLKGAAILPKKPGCLDRVFKTDDEVDFVSAPFGISKRSVFEGIGNPDTFFRSSQRSFLVHNILINMDVREDVDRGDPDYVKHRGNHYAKLLSCLCLSSGSSTMSVWWPNDQGIKVVILPGVDLYNTLGQGLPYMLLNEVYTDAFILHDETQFEDMTDDEADELRQESLQKGTFKPADDPREELHRTWSKCCKYQPLWKIRNYFGEQIAFYFAWAGSMATALWVPMVLGIAIWAFGLYVSVKEYTEQRQEQQALTDLASDLEWNITLYNRTEDWERLANITQQMEEWSVVDLLTEDWLVMFKNSFDNDATPYFALLICLWGTIFLEYWKRKSSTLAYEWDVNSYHLSEPDRPQFFGTRERMDPVSDLPDWYYPVHRQFLKYFASLAILFLMVSLVIASVIGIIAYRVITRFLLKDEGSILKLMVSTVMATVINSCVIMILGKIYEKIAIVLTDWENHRTQSQYDDALVLKLFAFSFVNTFSSLFYIAFFREQTTEGGVFDLGAEYTDSCDNNNCMAMLSLQVFVLMVMKPCPRFFKDIIIPYVKKLIRKYRCWGRNKVSDINKGSLSPQAEFIQKERLKPPVGNFTLGEYNEKVILYGFLMVFSSALPLAPLIALVVILVDLVIDARRLIWFNRRPIGLIASNIGMWFNILEFLNYVGVVTNAFIIAFTSQWGKKFSDTEKLWIVIGFEHIVFGVKFFLEYIIPDTPAEVSLAMRRERYQVAKIMAAAKDDGPMEGNSNLSDGSSAFSDQNSSVSPPKLVYGQGGNTYLEADQHPAAAEKGADLASTSRRRKKKKKHKEDSPRAPDLQPIVTTTHPPAQAPGYGWNVPPGTNPSYGWNGPPPSHPADNASLAYPPRSTLGM